MIICPKTQPSFRPFYKVRPDDQAAGVFLRGLLGLFGGFDEGEEGCRNHKGSQFSEPR